MAIRYPRGSESKVVFGNCKEIELGKAEIFDNNIYKKDDVTNIYLPGDIDDDFKSTQLEIPFEDINEDCIIKIIGIGKMVTRAFELSQMLYKRNGIESTLINARFLKPFDKDIVLDYNDKEDFSNQYIITIEDGTLNGGLYSTVIQTINDRNKFITANPRAAPQIYNMPLCFSLNVIFVSFSIFLSNFPFHQVFVFFHILLFN